MGLDIRTINRYGNKVKEERFGSYGRIHILRKWIYKNLDGFTDKEIESYYDYKSTERIDLNSKSCPAICNHSDADGGYIDTKQFSVGLHNDMEWADVNDLNNEITKLKEMRDKMSPEVQEVFDDLAKLVEDEEGDLISIIYFQ